MHYVKGGFSLLSRDTVYSSMFLDALRGQLHQWSLTLFDPESGGFRCNQEIGPNVLSTTDVVWIRYATGDPDVGAPDRDKIVRYLQGKQDPRTGKIPHDPGPAGQGHVDGHAFWQAVRALRILDAQLFHFPAHLEPMSTPAGLDAWFASFNWDGSTGGRPGYHHEILGLIPMIASVADEQLTEALFRNLAEQQNPQAGTWPRAKTSISRTFAYTALHMATGRLPNLPERIVDEVLRLQNDSGLWDAQLPGFGSMDSAYLLVRLARRIGYRQDEAVAALRRLSSAMRHMYAAKQAVLLNNTHPMVAVAHTFGLLQEAFPDEYRSERPYRFDWDKLDLYVCQAIT
jgi:hypothetical protein